MCFAGIFDINERIKEKESINKAAVFRMAKRASLNAEIFSGVYISRCCAAGYIETSYCDMSFASDDSCAAFVLLPISAQRNRRNILPAKSAIDMYSAFGNKFSEYMQNDLSGAVVDNVRKVIILFRGVSSARPLFYAFIRDRLCFSSAVKGLFELSEIRPVLSSVGLFHLFNFETLPAEGSTVYDGIASLPPRSCAICSTDGVFVDMRCITDPKTHMKRTEYSSLPSGNIRSLSDDRVMSLLSEIAIIRDVPSYSVQGDILGLYEKCFLDPISDIAERAPIGLLKPHGAERAELSSASVRSEYLPSFGPVLQTKLRAFMRDKTQSVHRIVHADTVLSCLNDPEHFEKSLFFVLQLCLWLNHYKVYVAL